MVLGNISDVFFVIYIRIDDKKAEIIRTVHVRFCSPDCAVLVFVRQAIKFLHDNNMAWVYGDLQQVPNFSTIELGEFPSRYALMLNMDLHRQLFAEVRRRGEPLNPCYHMISTNNQLWDWIKGGGDVEKAVIMAHTQPQMKTAKLTEQFWMRLLRLQCYNMWRLLQLFQVIKCYVIWLC